MSEPKTVEEAIPNIIKFYLEEAEKLSKAYNVNRTEALQIITLIELAKIHTHIDKMADTLQLIEAKKIE